MIEHEQNLEELREEFPHWFRTVEKESFSSRFLRDLGNEWYCKKNHNWEIHSRILSTYSQSAAVAPNGSEELALAYGNRSALLLHLKRYDECLIDIERACEITKSAALKDKLEARRAQCLSLRSEGPKSSQDQQTESVIRLKKKFKPSKEIPCASSSVSIQMDAKNGRHIVATQDIEPGTIIAIEKSAAAIPINDCMFLNCDRCLKFAWNGVPCDSCANVIFCSEKCKKEAWSEYHDIECVIFSSFSVNNIGYANNVKLSIRIFIKSVKQEGLDKIFKVTLDLENNKDKHLNRFFDKGVFQSNKLKSILNLSKSKTHFQEQENFLLTVIDFLEANTKFFDSSKYDCGLDNALLAKECIIEVFLITMQNSTSAQYADDFSKFSSELDMFTKLENEFGTILAPFSSLFNHGCYSNIGRVYISDQEIVLYAETVIKKGDQMYQCYGPNTNMRKNKRQFFLRTKYRFICECFYCTEKVEMDNWLVNINMKVFEGIIQELVSMGIDLYKFSNFIKNITSISNIDYLEKILKDIATALKVVHKHTTGAQAVFQSIPFIDLIQKFFITMYGTKNGVPVKC